VVLKTMFLRLEVKLLALKTMFLRPQLNRTTTVALLLKILFVRQAKNLVDG